MAKIVFKDGITHGTLYSVELGTETDPTGNKVQYWEFAANLDKGAVHTPYDLLK
jgi:hypothetical protein